MGEIGIDRSISEFDVGELPTWTADHDRACQASGIKLC